MTNSSFAPIMNSLVVKYADWIEMASAQHSSALSADKLDMLADTQHRMWCRSVLIIDTLAWEQQNAYWERATALVEERKTARRRRAGTEQAYQERLARERDEDVARILMAICE